VLYRSPKAKITLIDNDIAALNCSQYILNKNSLKGTLILSNVYSNVFQKFDLIISNPPFHDNLYINFSIIKEIIYNSKKYLTSQGELRFVVNTCFNYNFLLSKTFKKYGILKKTEKYKIYQDFLK